MGPPTPPSPSKEIHPSNYYYFVIAVAAAALLLVMNVVAIRCCSCCGLLRAIRRLLLSLGVLARPPEDEHISQLVPACKYRKEQAAAADNSECSVCLTVFAEGEDVRQLPECRHSFHAPCIDKWLRSHANCPLCRGSVLPAPLRCPKAEASHQSLIVSGAMTGVVVYF